jgi:hypothetical protein
MKTYNKRFLCYLSCILIVFSTISCIQPIDDNLLIVVADEVAPSLDITAPLFNSSYVSEMVLEGTLFDSSQKSGDRKGKLASLTLTFLEASQYNRQVVFDEAGNETLIPSEEDFFTFDKATGAFSLIFNTVGLTGTQYLTVIAEDRNQNTTSHEITLIDPQTGPVIEILSPDEDSTYLSMVDIHGTVRDRGSTTDNATVGEVQSLSYSIPVLSIEEDVSFNEETGEFNFQISAEGYSGDFSITLVAYDKNGRSTRLVHGLSGDDIGPVVTINSPIEDSAYASGVTVTGFVRDKASTEAAPTVDEIQTLTYKINSLSIEETTIIFNTPESTPGEQPGEFSFSFPTTGYKGTFSITISAVDFNGRKTTKSLRLLGDEIGPTLSITSPATNTYYRSSVTVAGLARDRFSTVEFPATDEIAALYYLLPGQTRVKIYDYSDPLLDDTLSSGGVYSFSFSSVDFSSTLKPQVIAADKNGRETITSIDLLTYPSGPVIDIIVTTSGHGIFIQRNGKRNSIGPGKRGGIGRRSREPLVQDSGS